MPTLTQINKIHRSVNNIREALNILQFRQIDGNLFNMLPYSPDREGLLQIERLIVEQLQDRWSVSADGVLQEIDDMIKSITTFPLTNDVIDEQILPVIAQRLGPNLVDEALLKNITQLGIDTNLHGKLKTSIATGLLEPEFYGVDYAAQEWLRRDTLYWVNNFYDRHLGSKIADIAKDVGIEQGLGRYELARELVSQLGDQFQKPLHYWEIVGSAATVRGSHAGGVIQAHQLGITRMTRYTSSDERVCFVCGPMHGLVWETSKSYDLVNQLIEAEQPEDVKDITPWILWDPKKEWTDKSGIKRIGGSYYKKPGTGKRRYYLGDNLTNPYYLQSHGLSELPVHGDCRCEDVPEVS